MPTIANDPGYQQLQAATGGKSAPVVDSTGMQGFAAAAKQWKNMRAMQPQAKERTDYNITGSGGVNFSDAGVNPSVGGQ